MNATQRMAAIQEMLENDLITREQALELFNEFSTSDPESYLNSIEKKVKKIKRYLPDWF
jgi:hypothetical protein